MEGTTLSKRERLKALKRGWEDCRACKLCESSKQVVFEDGDPDCGIMFIGEAPGETEDETGVPFTGASGILLEEMVKSMGKTMNDLYFTNTVLCHPEDNRNPSKPEMAACRPRLMEQIKIVDPMLIIASGAVAATTIAGTKVAVTKDRGSITDVEFDGDLGRYKIPVLMTLHPAYVMRKPDTRKGGAMKNTMADLRSAFQITDRLKEMWGKER
tara:strand:+ start:159 stop:797 length:639 start_codon:yes stop_codon:yes gene_type:complete